jgi:uncharacterized protein YjiS (DUF1127 family)
MKEERMPAAFSKNASEIFGRRLPRAIGNAHAWHGAWSFLRIHLGRPARAVAAEFGTRCAINHLRALDDHRLWDLGLRREHIEHFVRFGRDERPSL